MRRFLRVSAFVTVSTALAIACNINPQPLPPDSDRAADSGTSDMS